MYCNTHNSVQLTEGFCFIVGLLNRGFAVLVKCHNSVRQNALFQNKKCISSMSLQRRANTPCWQLLLHSQTNMTFETVYNPSLELPLPSLGWVCVFTGISLQIFCKLGNRIRFKTIFLNWLINTTQYGRWNGRRDIMKKRAILKVSKEKW